MGFDFEVTRSRLLAIARRVEKTGWPTNPKPLTKKADQLLEMAMNLMTLAELLETLLDQAKRSLEIHDRLLASAKAEQEQAVAAERGRVVGLIEEWASHFEFNDEIQAGHDLENMIEQLSDPGVISFAQMIEERERKAKASSHEN